MNLACDRLYPIVVDARCRFGGAAVEPWIAGPPAFSEQLSPIGYSKGSPMHIGLIGGIGVAATVVYYQRLVAAVAKREAGAASI